MLISFFRAVILLALINVVMRLMGKRQIGQLQPSELVITILLSEIAATPMQDNDIPLSNTVVAVMVLVGLEIVMSYLSLKSSRVRSVLEGNALILIRNGIIDVPQLKRLRFSLDDVSEALRQNGVFNIDDVQYAIAETDGSLSVLLKPEKRTTTGEFPTASPPDSGLVCTIISDGRIERNSFKDCGMTEQKLTAELQRRKLNPCDILLMTADSAGNYLVYGRDGKKCED